MLAILLLLVGFAQDPEVLPVLKPGMVKGGVIEESDPPVVTDELRKSYSEDVVRGKSFRVEVPNNASYYIELRSYFFDAYLVLRDDTNSVISEDDDGLVHAHSRLILPFVSEGNSYRLDACALHGGTGAFEVRLREGKPESLSPAAKRAADLADARESVRVIEGARGPNHPDTATSLNNMAMLLDAQGDFAAARPLYERALSIRETALGRDHSATSSSLNNLALLLEEQGDYAGAKRLMERALSICERVLGSDHIETSRCLVSLASLLKTQGDYEGARPLYERALAIREKVLGPEHPDTALSLNNLAGLLKDQGDLDEARSLYERALTIYEKALGPEHPDTTMSMNNLASLLLAQGDHEGAGPLQERALSISEKVCGSEHPKTALYLNNLAGLLREQGDYEGARPLSERALSIGETVHGSEHPRTALYLNSLARLLRAQGDFEGARPLYERALSIREEVLGPEHPDTALSLNGLAGLLEDQGDYAGAKPLRIRSLSILEKARGTEHPDTATSLDNLARLLQAQGDYEGARPLHERALSIRERVLGPDHPRTATSLNNLGVFLSKQKDYAKATRVHERALSIRERILGPEHPETAMSLNNLGVVLKEQGVYGRARQAYERALSIRERILGPAHPMTTLSLNNLALLLLELNEPGEAMAISRRAIKGHEAHRQQLAWSLTETERLLIARTQRHALRLLLSIPGTALSDAYGEREIYETVLAWKAQVFRSLAQSRGSMLASLGEADRARVQSLRQLQARLSRELFKRDVKNPNAHQELLAGLRKKRETLESELTRSLGPADELRTPSIAELGAVLPDDSIHIGFLIHPVYEPTKRDETGIVVSRGRYSSPRLSAWVGQSGKGAIQRLDLGEVAPIEAATREFLNEMVARQEITPPRGISLVREKSHLGKANNDLIRLLWKPLSEHVGNAKQILVSPDGFLGTLPLETLQLADRSYLLEHHAFVYLEDMPSVTDIASRPARQDATLDLLCVGNVDYRTRSDLINTGVPNPTPPPPPLNLFERSDVRGGFLDRWTPLPGTEEESHAISKIHKNRFDQSFRLILRGPDATEERLKIELPRHRVVHLATHGFFQPDLPSMWRQAMADEDEMQMEMFEEEERFAGLMPGLLSGLVLAGANRTPAENRDDGLLTAEEISFLDLSGVDLVVLSACETALGKSEAGEGMLGLRRTFRQAGARTVISSLWSIGDDSTSALMRRFYERLWIDGEPKLDALRGAQLDILKQNRIENDGDGLPSTWGAFVLDGTWK